ncbi:MAG: shikimate dehydrogenase [Nitrospirae bacterium]|nr:shikimate dehydrogenase [Nitrospirota bacterium]
MNVSGKTKVLGIFGFPVEHTLSPLMHNAAFKTLGLDMCYLPFKVSPDDLPDAVNAIKALNILGVNVTVPHKEKVIPLLDEVDREALFIGAVNTIVNQDGKLKGYNTDGRGFIKSLSEARISISRKNVLIVGTGGASRAISYYMSEKASGLFLYDINTKKAGRLIKDLKKLRRDVSFFDLKSEKFDEMDIIINATPLGLKKEDPLPFDINQLGAGHVVCDLIYRRTTLLDKASKKGCRTLSGLGMLLWQGVFAFELWTGMKPPVEVMRKAIALRI